MSRDDVADYLLTHVGGDESDPWQAGHNYAMRKAARLVREKWDEIPAPSGSDEQGNRPATPDANGVHDTKGGEGRG